MPSKFGGIPVEDQPQGLVTPGNIDLYNRPHVKNSDGSVSTVRSMSFGDNGKEVLVPTVAADGSGILSDDDAIKQYWKSGQHLGIFDNPDHATAYAKQLHEDYAAGKYDSRPGGSKFGGIPIDAPLQQPPQLPPSPKTAGTGRTGPRLKGDIPEDGKGSTILPMATAAMMGGPILGEGAALLPLATSKNAMGAARQGALTARATPSIPLSPRGLGIDAGLSHLMGLPPWVGPALDTAGAVLPKVVGFVRGAGRYLTQKPFGPEPGTAPAPLVRTPVWEKNVSPDQTFLRDANRAVSAPSDSALGQPSSAPLLKTGSPEDAGFLEQYRRAVSFPRAGAHDLGVAPDVPLLKAGQPSRSPIWKGMPESQPPELPEIRPIAPPPRGARPLGSPTPRGPSDAPLVRTEPTPLSRPGAADIASKLFEEAKSSGTVPETAKPGEPLGTTEEESPEPFKAKARDARNTSASTLAGMLHKTGIPSGDLVHMGDTDWGSLSKAANVEFPLGRPARTKLVNEVGRQLRGMEGNGH